MLPSSMTTSSVPIAAQHPRPPLVAPGKKKRISWTEFQKKYLHREDGYKYEWVDGAVEKTRRSMDKSQLFILRNLLDFFLGLKTNAKAHGQLIAEPDLFFANHHRRPDIAWLTDAQIDRLAHNSEDVPAFIIEIVSTHDQMNLIHRKMLDYQAAGVQVVWHLFPLLDMVHVYSGVQLSSMRVCQGDQLCSAAPVLPDFELPAAVVLKKPAPL